MKINKNKTYSNYLPKIAIKKDNWGVAFQFGKGIESLEVYGHNITHKVFGWSFGIIPNPNDKNRQSFSPHHNHSQRVGFSIGEDGMTLYAYFYNGGGMYREILASGLPLYDMYHVSFTRMSSGCRVKHNLSQMIGNEWMLINSANSHFDYPFAFINYSLNFAIGSGETAPKDLKVKTWITR